MQVRGPWFRPLNKVEGSWEKHLLSTAGHYMPMNTYAWNASTWTHTHTHKGHFQAQLKERIKEHGVFIKSRALKHKKGESQRVPHITGEKTIVEIRVCFACVFFTVREGFIERREYTLWVAGVHWKIAEERNDVCAGSLEPGSLWSWLCIE